MAASLVAQGFNVKVANATNTDFWNMISLLEPIEEIVLPAVPNHHSNIHGATRIRASGFNCCVVAIATHETEVEETLKMGIPSFNLYRLTGEGLEREAIDEIKLKES